MTLQSKIPYAVDTRQVKVITTLAVFLAACLLMSAMLWP